MLAGGHTPPEATSLHPPHFPRRAAAPALLLAAMAAHAAAVPAPACTLKIAGDAQVAARNGFAALAPGSTVCIAPGTYDAPLAIVGAKGTAGAPISFVPGPQPGPVHLNAGLLLRASAYVTVSGLNVTLDPRRGPGAAVNVDKGTSNSTIRGLTVENAFVGISLGSSDGPSGPGNEVVDNISRNNWNTGIAIDRSDGTAAANNRIRRNRVSGNGGHGIEVTEANYIAITENVVTGNGTGVRSVAHGGYSGIHLYAVGPTLSNPAGPRCTHNVIASNKVEGTLERPYDRPCDEHGNTCGDGNGIQVDHDCNGNAVVSNTTTGNAGDGISLYGASNNTVHDNFAYGNNLQVARVNIVPGPGEIAISAVNLPAGSASGNVVYNNVAVTTVHKIPAFFQSENTGRNTLGPNNTWRWAPESNPGWTWGPVYIGRKWYSAADDVDEATGTSGNVVGLQPR